ncbi:MAG TPA: S9 family peptidase [Candidatus Limnocylindria bacterium]|nr:S9 family peptidase [Candidatus Limnocylindria bacterium]
MSSATAPLTAEDLAAFAFVNEAAISPAGDRVAYAVRRMDLDADRYRAAIFVSAVDGSGSARWTDDLAEDATPRWSPDGTRIAFVSDRGEVPEGKKRAPKSLFLIDAPGAEPRQIARFPDDCGDLTWLPSGSGLIVTLKDAATAQPDDAPKVYDRLRYKSDEGGLLDLRRKHLWLVPLDSAPRKLTDGDWDDTQPSVSPDGTMLAFTSNRSADRDRNTVSDIWVTPVAGGSATRITTERGQYANASWSPDGAAITCLGTADAIGAGARNTRVWRFSSGGGAGTDLLGGWDRTTGSRVMSDVRGETAPLAPVWTKDGRVLFIGSDRGTANLYSVSARGGDVRAETLGAHQLVTATLDREAHCFAGVIATPTSPGEVVTGQPGGGMRTITSLNAELLGARYIAAPEQVRFAGADGWAVEGWLLKPPGFDPAKRWPLVLEIHGGPHGAYGHSFFHEFQVLAGRGYAVLYTNPRGSHAYGDTFVRACVGDWGGKDYLDLMAGVDHVLGLGWVDPQRLYVTGGSYGGFMTNWIVGHTDRFRAAVTQRSISNNISAFGTSDIGWHFWQYEMGDATPWRDEQKLVARSPLTYVQEVRTPLLILHAEKDFRCPIEQAEQLFVALKVLGKEATLVRYQDDTHELTRGGKPKNRIDHARRIADWFDAHR